MVKKEFEITKILETKLAIHLFASKVKHKLKEAVSFLNLPTLFIINLRNNDLIDYGFVEIAFEDVFAENANANLFIAIMIDGYDRDELFTGIAHIRNFDTSDNLSDEKRLIKNGVNLILVDKENKVSYITNLSEEHMQVLGEIENHEKITSEHLQKKFSLIAENATRILEGLLISKFIYSKDEGPNNRYYFSIKSLIA